VQTPTSSTLEGSDVTVAIHRKPACRIELEVKASPILVAAARKEAIKRVGKEVVFPGFRKGKAPEEIILKKYADAVEQEWHKAIADLAFMAAQKKERVPLLSNTKISFDLKNHSLIQGAEISFTFETEPTVPSVDTKLFEAKPIAATPVGDKEIDEAIRQTRFFFAQWNPLKDRGIQNGDYIMIDLDTLEDTPTKVFDHIRFEVSDERMAPWMKNLVIGAKAGDVLEGMTQPDANASEEEQKEFPPKKVRLTIHKAEEATLPAVDDEFAQKMGAGSVDAMRDSIRTILQQNVDDKEKTVLREQVNDFLTSTYRFEVPLSLIAAEETHRKQQANQRLDKLSPEEKKKAEKELYDQSEEAIRLFYLTRKLVQDAQISITQADVQNQAIESAKAFGEQLDPAHLPKEVFALALSKVLMTKAQDYVLANSKQA
jgi:trigger factor